MNCNEKDFCAVFTLDALFVVSDVVNIGKRRAGIMKITDKAVSVTSEIYIVRCCLEVALLPKLSR